MYIIAGYGGNEIDIVTEKGKLKDRRDKEGQISVYDNTGKNIKNDEVSNILKTTSY